MQTALSPTPETLDGNTVHRQYPNLIPRVFSEADYQAAQEARKEKFKNWAELGLRQHFADEAWMRDHIKAAGLRAPYRGEPATATRLRGLLHHAGIHSPEIFEAVGTTLSGYLKLNPNLPLWAALALVLEATEKFTVTASGLSQGEGALTNVATHP
jgi:hypothetical protein